MKTNKRYVWFILLLLLLLSACSEKHETVHVEPVIETPPETFLSTSHLTDVENAYLTNLKLTGTLKVATRPIEYVYDPHPDGTVSGFNFRLLKSFADEIGIDLDLQLVEFSDYFYKEGYNIEDVKADPSIAYVPDLLEEVDLYCDVLTVTPWREKLFAFVKTLPVKEVIVAPKALHFNSLKELDGKKVALIRHSTYEQTVNRICAEENITLDLFYVSKSVEQQQAIMDGNADFAVQDIFVAISELDHFKTLSVSLPVTETRYIGWGVHPENKELQSLLTKYLDYAMNYGVFEEIWYDEYHISIPEYLGLMNIE